jgi:hypothetical protein
VLNVSGSTDVKFVRIVDVELMSYCIAQNPGRSSWTAYLASQITVPLLPVFMTAETSLSSRSFSDRSGLDSNSHIASSRCHTTNVQVHKFPEEIT